MTREEFESILEEAYIEGYNTALEDIQEDILDEEAYDLEGEYEYYTESLSNKDKLKVKEFENSEYAKQLKSEDPKQFEFLKRSKIATLAANRNTELAEKAKQDEERTNKYFPGVSTKSYIDRRNQKINASKRMIKSAKRYHDKILNHQIINSEKEYLKSH